MADDEKRERQLTASELDLLHGTSKAVEGKDVKGLDLVVRNLKDIADGKMEGYDANQKALAKDLAVNLTKIIVMNIPEYGEYLETYAKLSEPLKPFKTPLGRAIVEGKMQVDKIPDAIFQNKASFDNFRQMAGDEEFVQTMARKYTAGNLNRALSGKSPRRALPILNRWMNDHEWLNPTDTPELYGKTRGLQDNLKSAKRTRTGALIALVVALVLACSFWLVRGLHL